MQVNRIIADLHVDDIEAARGFYTGFLGLSTEEFNLGWVARYASPDNGVNVLNRPGSGGGSGHWIPTPAGVSLMGWAARRARVVVALSPMAADNVGASSYCSGRKRVPEGQTEDLRIA